MKKSAKYTAFLLAFMTISAVTGCEKQSPAEEDSDSVSVISEITTTLETENPEETTAPEEIPTEEVTDETQEVTTENTTTESVENAVDYMSVLNAYHQAYIDGNADAVYALFNPNEIMAFDTYMKSYLQENLSESEEMVEEMFSKENILSAIKGSVENIHDIMENYNETNSDIWSISIDEATIEQYSAEELSQINADLGMNITDGYICEIPFYKNEINEETFVAEPASVFQIDGFWYISYSVACDRLIEFMDIEF